MRLIIAAVIALIAIMSYYGRPGDENQVTGKTERVAMDDEADEVRMGLQAVPQMAQMHGGKSRDAKAVVHVEQIGEKLLRALDKELAVQGRTNPYRNNFQFTLLDDPKT